MESAKLDYKSLINIGTRQKRQQQVCKGAVVVYSEYVWPMKSRGDHKLWSCPGAAVHVRWLLAPLGRSSCAGPHMVHCATPRTFHQVHC